VSYNTADLTIDCIASVREQTVGCSFEIIVVDNASPDDSADRIAERFPDIRLIASKKNYGFGVASNIGAYAACGDWILLLNPDTVVKDNAIDKLLGFARSNEHGAIFGGRTVDEEGNLDPTSCWAKTTPWSAFTRAVGLSTIFRQSSLFNPEMMLNWQRDSVREVDIITGCFLLVSAENWKSIGGFDPRFFMYGEEADLCLRAAEKGMKLFFCPTAEIMHYGGASETVRADKVVRLFRAKAQVFALHWSKGAAAFGRFTLDFWSGSRSFVSWIFCPFSESARNSHEAWINIWKRRAEWHKPDERPYSALTVEELRVPIVE